MNQLKHISKSRLRGELLLRGHTISSWAKANGFPQIAALMAIDRHCGNAESIPRGVLTCEIINRLIEEIQKPVEPLNGTNGGAC